MAIDMSIHPDVTGQDTKAPEDLVNELKSEEAQASLTANNGLFLSSAQSSDANLAVLADDKYSDPETQKQVVEACNAGQCSYDGGLPNAAIIGIAVGSSIGGCCCCLGCIAVIYFFFIKKKDGASSAAPPATSPAAPHAMMPTPAPMHESGVPGVQGWSGPAAVPMAPLAPAAPVPSRFCAGCGTQGMAGAPFCGKCGASLAV
jgi:hypothetical protein